MWGDNGSSIELRSHGGSSELYLRDTERDEILGEWKKM